MYDYDGCLPPYIQVFSPLFYVAGHDCMTAWPMSGRKSAMGKLKLRAHTAKPKARNSIAGNVTKSPLQGANHNALDEVLLQEGVNAHDRDGGNHDNGHLDGLLRGLDKFGIQ